MPLAPARATAPRWTKLGSLLLLAAVLLGSPHGNAAGQPLTLQALERFDYDYKHLLSHRGPVRQMTIQIDTVDQSSDEPYSASSAVVEINRTNTTLTLTFQQGEKREYRQIVDTTKRLISEQAVTQVGAQRKTTQGVRRFNNAGCNLSSTFSYWSLEATTQAKAPDRTEVQTFCDTTGRPTREVIKTFAARNTFQPYTDIGTWTWSPDHTSVAQSTRGYAGKTFFNGKGDPITELADVPLQRIETKTTYVYDARGNWTRRTITVRSGDEDAKILTLQSTTTVTREITYW